MYLGLSALSYRLVPRAGSPASPGLAALGPEKYPRRTALGTKMYPGQAALSYRLVPRAGSPACPGLAALGPEKYTGRTALGTKMYPGQAAPGTWGMDILTSNGHNSGLE